MMNRRPLKKKILKVHLSLAHEGQQGRAGPELASDRTSTERRRPGLSAAALAEAAVVSVDS
jgi:hypothetical protein